MTKGIDKNFFEIDMIFNINYSIAENQLVHICHNQQSITLKKK